LFSVIGYRSLDWLACLTVVSCYERALKQNWSYAFKVLYAHILVQNSDKTSGQARGLYINPERKRAGRTNRLMKGWWQSPSALQVWWSNRWSILKNNEPNHFSELPRIYWVGSLNNFSSRASMGWLIGHALARKLKFKTIGRKKPRLFAAKIVFFGPFGRTYNQRLFNCGGLFLTMASSLDDKVGLT